MEPIETSGDIEGTESITLAALTRLAGNIFAATVVGPALTQLGQALGDQARLFRIRNLIRISDQLERILTEKDLNANHVRKVSLAVGLPLLEKASYQDDEVLQRMWANLLASAMEGSGADEQFSLDITYVEILHQLTRLDCEVLAHVVENGFRGKSPDGFLVIRPLDPMNIRDEFVGQLAHLSLEKLVSLGCAYRVVRAPLSTTDGDGYGPMAHDITATLIGLNLYMAASGQEPAWHDYVLDEAEQTE